MDMLITDPPYNIAYVGKNKDALTIANDNLSRTEFVKFLSAVLANAYNVMRDGSAFYIWHAATNGADFETAIRAANLEVKQQLIWEKNRLVLGQQDYQWEHEPCFYGWKDGARHLWNNDRKQTTVLNFDRPTKNGEHPTMKPVKLFDYQISNNTRPGDCVLDLFGGSGTTAIACEQNNRSAYLMEIDPKYCDVIIDRWEKFTGERANCINRA